MRECLGTRTGKSGTDPEKAPWDAVFPEWLKRFLTISPGSIVALARVFLAGFAFLSVYVDATQPAGDLTFTYAVLISYVAYSFVLALVVLSTPLRGRLALASHAIDIAVLSVLVHLTNGPESPLFVYFTFALFSATLRWSWRGALATTVAIVLIFIFLSIAHDAGFWAHLDRVIVRTAYLVTAGAFFCYFSAALESTRRRLARLAEWPVSIASPSDNVPFDIALSHTADVLDLTQALTLWQFNAEHKAWVAVFSDGVTRYQEMAQGLAGDELPDTPCLIGGPQSDPMPRALKSLARQGSFDHWITVPMKGTTLRGWLCLGAGRRMGRDLFPLAAIAANRVVAELEQHQLRLKLVEAATIQERMRLAQEIHDDVLQTLTALALQVKVVERDAPPRYQERLARLREQLTDQQARLRDGTSPIRARPSADRTFAVAQRLPGLCVILEEKWSCSIRLSIQPEDLTLSQYYGHGLSMAITEAVANGVRHGGASEFKIDVWARTRRLTLRIDDNGAGAPDLTGTFSHETVFARSLGSASLRTRVQNLGWRMEMSSSPKGLEIVVTAPLDDRS
jgi:signal transduction histidine kinase